MEELLLACFLTENRLPFLRCSLQHTAIVTSEALKNSQVGGGLAADSARPKTCCQSARWR